MIKVDTVRVAGAVLVAGGVIATVGFAVVVLVFLFQ